MLRTGNAPTNLRCFRWPATLNASGIGDLSDSPSEAGTFRACSPRRRTKAMTSTNTMLRYGNVAMTFHWAIALLIATNLSLGFYFANVMNSHDPAFFAVIQIHKSIGLTILVLSLLRLGWRLVNPIPPLPKDFGWGMKILA